MSRCPPLQACIEVDIVTRLSRRTMTKSFTFSLIGAGLSIDVRAREGEMFDGDCLIDVFMTGFDRV